MPLSYITIIHFIIHIMFGIRMVINTEINGCMKCKIHMIVNNNTNARIHNVNIMNTNPANYTCNYTDKPR